MSDIAQNPDRSEQTERLMTAVSGWAGLVSAILGLHRWVALGNMDWWARAGLIVGVALGIWWAWGYWPEISSRVRAWVRGGGLNTTLVAIGLIICLVIVNTLVRRRLPLKADLTKNKRYTLAPQTLAILKGLKQPVHATVFVPAGRNIGKARDLFKQYADAGRNFTWNHVDPLTNLNVVLSKKPKLGQDLTGAYLEVGDKRQDITDFTEKEVTGAILKLTNDRVRKVYFLQGHGEMSFDAMGGGNPSKTLAQLTNTLKDQQWQVDKLNLFGKDVKTPDPEEAAAIIIAGPEKPLADQEKKRLSDYLDKGGKVLLLLTAGGSTYDDFVKPWGIQTTNDVVLDRTQDQGLVLVDQAEQHPAVKDIRRVLFAPMRSVRSITPTPNGITVTPLIKTGSFTSVVADYKPGTRLSAGTEEAQIPVAELAEKKIGTNDNAKKGQLLVVGDATFASDVMANFPVYNQALASGLINYLGQEEALVAIPPKDENTEQAFLTPDQGRLLMLIHFWDFPLLALFLAIVVYLKRR